MALATYKDLCIDATDPQQLAQFWAPVLGWRPELLDDGDACLRDGDGRVQVWVNSVPEAKTVKNRIHLDVNVHGDDAVDGLVAAGAAVLDADSHRRTVLTDPDGQEFCAFVRSEPHQQRLYELVWDSGVDARACHDIARWWSEVLGAALVDDERGFSWVEQIPQAPFASMDFVPVPEPKTTKNRVHIDVTTDDVEPLLVAGANVVHSKGDGGLGWHVLADPDGNEFCAFTP